LTRLGLGRFRPATRRPGAAPSPDGVCLLVYEFDPGTVFFGAGGWRPRQDGMAV
jgi:hypothetical protein